jgi:hypothetical protein
MTRFACARCGRFLDTPRSPVNNDATMTDMTPLEALWARLAGESGGTGVTVFGHAGWPGAGAPRARFRATGIAAAARGASA